MCQREATWFTAMVRTFPYLAIDGSNMPRQRKQRCEPVHSDKHFVFGLTDGGRQARATSATSRSGSMRLRGALDRISSDIAAWPIAHHAGDEHPAAARR